MTEAYLTRAMQHPGELAAFAELVRDERCTSYLEIGCKFGGMMWAMAQELLPRSRIVGVDIRKGHRLWQESEESLEACISKLLAMGFDARLVWGDSTSVEVIEVVRALGPFDLIFIDANHTMPFVVQDWKNYGPLARIVAFHDISPNERHDIDVPDLWAKLREQYRSTEIRLDQYVTENGIGVLWRDDRVLRSVS